MAADASEEALRRRIYLVRTATFAVVIGSILLLPCLASLARAQTTLPNVQLGADHEPPACVVEPGRDALWSLALGSRCTAIRILVSSPIPAHRVGPCLPGASRSVRHLFSRAVAVELSFF
jgi:hypothetical protein